MQKIYRALCQASLWLFEPFNLFIILLACLPIIFTALYMGIHDENLPRLDEQRNLKFAIALDEGTFKITDLFYSIAGHYTIPTNAVAAFLIATTDWNLNYAMWINMALALICFGLYLLLAHRTQIPIYLLIVPLSLLVFSPMQDINWLVGYQSAWRFADMFLLIGLTLLVYFPQQWRSVIGAALCALLATFSIGSGFLSWGVLFAALWLTGSRNWKHYVFWITLSLLFVSLYIYTSRIEVVANPAETEVTTETVFLANPIDMLHFTFAYLGNNFGRDVQASTVFGFIGCVLLGINLLAVKEMPNHRPIWLLIAGYSAAIGLIVAMSRLNTRGMDRALTSWYYTSTTHFWIAFTALAIMLILYWQQQRNSWMQTVVIANLILGVIILGFFLYKNHFEVQVKQNLGTQAISEICGAKYILDMDDRCLAEHIYARATTLDQLAARKLSMYATLEPRHILPDGYQLGEPVIIETGSIWWNIHVRDWQLSNVPDSDILHIYPPALQEQVPDYPQPAIRENRQSELETWLNDTDSFWRIVTLDTPGYYNNFFDNLQNEGYGKDFTLLYDKLLVVHYRRIENSDSERTIFGDLFQLHHWELEETEEGQWLYTLWSANTVPPHNYSLLVSITTPTGELVREFNAGIGRIPTQLWKTDELFLDERRILLPDDLPVGEYEIWLTVYTITDIGFTSLAVETRLDNLASASLMLTHVTVHK